MARFIDIEPYERLGYRYLIKLNGNSVESATYTPVDEIKTVDAVPVVHGRWLKATGMMPPEYFGRNVCSVCDHFAPNGFHGTHEWLSPICPHCGAKMDEERHESFGDSDT